jgi:hypothetical protein
MRRACFFATAILFAATAAAQQTTTTLTASANPAVFGQAVTLTARVSPSGAAGKATFYDGVQVLGTSPLAGGQATLTTSLLSAGAHTLKAYYGGGGTFTASTSSSVALKVNALPSNAFRQLSATRLPSTGLIAVGDFNGDGKADIVAPYSVGISVFLGNGDGTFRPGSNISTPFSPVTIAVADFNGDGKSDLAVCYPTHSGGIQVFLGNGDGTFQSGASSLFAYAVGLAVGDFNGDGKADIAVSWERANELSILPGNGDGTFASPVTTDSISLYGVPLVSDFNRDGKSDLLFSSGYVFLGNGDGTFRQGANYPAGSQALGDLNGDGIADMVIPDANNDTITVYLGNGDGTFRQLAQYSPIFGVNFGSNLSSVVIADMNGDGNLDVMFSDPVDNVLGILYGNGDGTLLPPVFINAYAPVTPLVADFNGDSRPDVAFLNSGGTMLVLGGLPATTTTTTVTSSLNPSVLSQNVTLTATVTPSSVTGTVLFFDGPSFLGMRTLVNGQATFSTSLLTIGAHLITADYLGDASNPASLSPSLAQSVIAASHATSTTLGSSTNPAGFGQNLTLIANVAPSAATGTVTFYDGTSVLGIGVLSAGRAMLTTNLLASGTRKLTATYSGDANYGGSSSAPFTETVNASASGGFQPYVNLDGSGSFEGVVAADFNNDGLQDFAAAAGNSVNIYLGNGNGTFRTPINVTVSSGAYSIAAADFNRDGKVDIAVSSGSGMFSILPGNGDGTFQAALSYPGGGQYIWTADFNGDGKPDVLTGAGVLLGNGDGTFAPQLPVGNGYPVGITAVGDFNGDGKPDLAAFNSNTNTVSIFIGNGDGTFQPPTNYNVGISPTSVAAGDFNGDGKLDIAVANWRDSSLIILLGKGDGTFVVNTYSVAEPPGSVLVVGDFNGDGKPDLAGLPYASGRFAIFLGNGDGTFAAPTNVAVLGYPQFAAVADFNHDGKTDLIVTTYDGAVTSKYYAAVLLGGSHSSVSIGLTSNPSVYGQSVTIAATVVNTGLPPMGSVTFYDGTTVLGVRKLVNAVATLSTSLLAPGQRPLRVYYSGGNGYIAATSPVLTLTVNPVADAGFSMPATYAINPAANSIAVGDFNGDGKADIAVANGNFVSVLINNGNGAFKSPVNYTGGDYPAGSGPNAVAIGDFNGDQAPDLALVTVAGNLILLVGNGDGTFRQGPTFLVTNANPGNSLAGLVAGDFNGDGKFDIAICDANGTVNVLIGNGDNSFQPPQFYAGIQNTFNGNPVAITMGDFNGDGKPDLAFTNLSYGDIGVLLGNGDGTFQPPVNYATGASPNAIVAGDINGDGKADLVVANSGGSYSVLSGNGDGTFMPAVNHGLPGLPSGVVEADLNGDGKVDLAFTNSSGGVSVLPGNGDGTFGAAINYNPGTASNAAAVADFNGDGRVDLAVAGQGVYVLPGKAGVNSSVGIFRNGGSVIEDSNGNYDYDAGVDRFIASFTGPGGFVAGDVPVTGDWTGDGHAKIGIYRGSTGQWFLDANNNGTFDAGDLTYSFGGVAGDVPFVGDWAGLGKSCVGVFRSGFLWVLDLNCNGKFDDTPADGVFPFGGLSGDVPVVGAWAGGATRVGVVRKYAPAGVPIGNPFYWVLDGAAANAGTAPASHQPGFTFAFGGLAGDVFVTGDWYSTGTSVAGVYRSGLWVLDAALPSAPQSAHTTGLTFGYGGVLGDVPVVGRW